MSNQYYRDLLLNQLHNLSQGHMSVQDYITIYKDLTHYSDVREHHFETITKFVWGLWSKIRCAIITGP